jgi:hypothetical protein
MESSPVPARTARVTNPLPWSTRAAVLIVLLVGVSVLRPWGDGQPASAAGPAGSVPGRSPVSADGSAAGLPAGDPDTVPSAAPTPARTPGPTEIACPVAVSRLVTLDRLGQWTVRTWMPAAPAEATGPLDPAIPTIALDSQDVLGIGFCLVEGGTSAVDGPVLSADPARRVGLVRAWVVQGAAASPLALVPIRPASDMPGFALLYRPDDGLARASPWAAGRYVLSIGSVGLDGSATARPVPPDAADPRTRFIGVTIPPRR